MQKRILAALLIFYLALSALCFSIELIPSSHAFLDRHWSCIWMLGPSAALLYHETPASIVYGVTTGILFALMLLHCRTRKWETRALQAFFIAIFWALVGFYVLGWSV